MLPVLHVQQSRDFIISCPLAKRMDQSERGRHRRTRRNGGKTILPVANQLYIGIATVCNDANSCKRYCKRLRGYPMDGRGFLSVSISLVINPLSAGGGKYCPLYCIFLIAQKWRQLSTQNFMFRPQHQFEVCL